MGVLNLYLLVPCAILLSQWAVFICGAPTTTYNDEKTSQAVTVSFYQLSLSRWNDESLANKFKTAIANQVNTYCASNFTRCGINGSITFIPANVYINSDPLQNKAYLEVTFHVKYPDNVLLNVDASTNFVLPKSTVEAITVLARSGVRSAVGYEIVKVSDDIYYKSPDDRLNLILIPISCCLLLVVIIVAIALHCWSKKKAREADKAKLMEKKKKSKVGPSPHETPDKSKYGKHKHDRFNNEGDVNTNAGNYKDSMPSSKLPPLSNQDPEAALIDNDRAAEKDKKRHRKHKKSRKNKQNFENPTFTTESHVEVPVEEPGSSEVLIKSPKHNIVHEEKVANANRLDSSSDNENIKRAADRDKFIDAI